MATTTYGNGPTTPPTAGSTAGQAEKKKKTPMTLKEVFADAAHDFKQAGKREGAAELAERTTGIITTVITRRFPAVGMALALPGARRAMDTLLPLLLRGGLTFWPSETQPEAVRAFSQFCRFAYSGQAARAFRDIFKASADLIEDILKELEKHGINSSSIQELMKELPAPTSLYEDFVKAPTQAEEKEKVAR